MSDNYFKIVPQNPNYIPTSQAQQRMMAVARAMAPEAEEVSAEVFDHVVFFDAGENFERVQCPSCGSTIESGWWLNKMDDDFDGNGFRLASLVVPCCHATTTLNQLKYDWPQAFGRFSCTIMNPNLSEIGDVGRAELEAALGTPISVVRGRI